eukprot:6476624-Amphidinium_carterae.1
MTTLTSKDPQLKLSPRVQLVVQHTGIDDNSMADSCSTTIDSRSDQNTIYTIRCRHSAIPVRASRESESYRSFYWQLIWTGWQHALHLGSIIVQYIKQYLPTSTFATWCTHLRSEFAEVTTTKHALTCLFGLLAKNYSNICVMWHATALGMSILRQLCKCCGPRRSQQSPTTTQPHQPPQGRRGPQAAFGGPIFDRPPNVASLSLPLQHQLPPPRLLHGQGKRQRDLVNALVEHKVTAVCPPAVFDPPEELTPHCLYACLLKLTDAPITQDSLLQLRHAVQDVLAEAHRCDLEVSGFSLAQWLRKDHEGVLNYIQDTVCPSAPTSSRPGTTLDAAASSAILSVPVWVIDAQGSVAFRSTAYPPPLVIRHEDAHFTVIHNPHLP